MIGSEKRRACMYYPDCSNEAAGCCSGCGRHVCAGDVIRHESKCIGGRVTGYVCTRCKHPSEVHLLDGNGPCNGRRARGTGCGCPRFADPLAVYRGRSMAQEVRR